MKKIISVFAIAISCSLFSQEKMVRQKINEDISIEIPESFPVMSRSDRFQKVVSTKEPLALYTSEDGEVTLGVNWNRMPWMAGDEQTLYGFYKASISSMFDEVEFLQDEIKEIDGRKFIVFEFIGILKPDNAFSSTTSKNYTYIQYTSYNSQVLLFNFGCRARFMARYQEVAKKVMESVKVSEKR